MWTFDRYVYSRRFQVGREEILRPLPFGTNWQTLRIGIRFSVNDSARSVYNGATQTGYCIYLGVQEGTTTGFWNNTVTDWIGGGCIGSNANPDGTLNIYTAGSPGYYQTALGRPNALWKRSSTYVFATESSVSQYYTGSGENGAYGLEYFCGMYVDITKGSPYSITISYCNSAANAQTNLTEAAFLLNMENGGTPTLTQATSPARTITYTGAARFDTLSLVFSRFWPVTEIGSMAVVRYL